MLIEFRLKNYRCFKDEQVLSLAASTDKSLPENLIQAPKPGKIRLLRSLMIYGPNASGKTTLLNALEFVKQFVLNSGKRTPTEPINTDPFLLDAESAEQPSEFEVTFLQENVRYQYGFAVERRRIRREYLYAAPRGRTVPYFQRDRDEKSGKDVFYFGPSLKGQNEKISELTRENALYLSVSATLNHPILLNIFTWFDSIVCETQRAMGAYFLDKIDEQYHQGLRDLLRYADLGITDYRIKDARTKDPGVTGIIHAIGEEIEILHEAPGQGTVAFPLAMESNGTRHILFLGQRILAVLEKGGILAVDELDASIHPLLVRAIIQLFHNPEINRKGAQLIFNTHDTTLLDPTLFRRDQVWFTEKDEQGASHLYSLLEYSPRKGESLSKGYLQGRYGAIPFLGDPSMIFEKELST